MDRRKQFFAGLAFIIALALLLPLRNDETPAGTYVAHLLQESADSYATSNNAKCAKSFRDLSPFFPSGSHRIGGKAGVLPKDAFAPHARLYIGPPQEQTNNPTYVADLSPKAVDELLKGNSIYSLQELRHSGRIGYGTTTDQSRFVVICLHQDSEPVYRSGMIMILTNRGSVMELANNKIRLLK